MRVVERPEVFFISGPRLDWDEIMRYLNKVGERTGTNAESWAHRVMNDPDVTDGDALVELGGRLCYRSWVPEANVNVSKVRENSADYLLNILKSGHGSVTEHANYSFILDDVSRVFTHEFVRHRAGVGVSQESMRFVRLVDIPFWFPEWAREDNLLMSRSVDLLHRMEEHQRWMSTHFELDATDICPICEGSTTLAQPCSRCDGSGEVSKHPFSEKKHKTSFMRRFAPDGVATGMLATINVRAMRHIIYMRTALSAEEEIRIVLDDIAELALKHTPNLMQDYSPNENQEWIPDFLKI